MVAHTFDPSTQREAGGSPGLEQVTGDSWIYTEKSYLKKTKKKKKKNQDTSMETYRREHHKREKYRRCDFTTY